MDDRKPKEYKLLNEKEARDWLSLVMKINQGFELDERETERLGQGFTIFELRNVPEDIKNSIKKAENYYKINSAKN